MCLIICSVRLVWSSNFVWLWLHSWHHTCTFLVAGICSGEIICWSLLYTSTGYCAPKTCDSQWLKLFIVFLNVHQSDVLTTLFGCYMAGAMWSYCCLSAHSVYTIQPCTSLQCHFIPSHLHRVHVCLAVTCHLHFWHNDRDFFMCYCSDTRWNGYLNESQHRKLNLEKIFSHHSYWDLNPWLFNHESSTVNYWAIHAPQDTQNFEFLNLEKKKKKQNKKLILLWIVFKRDCSNFAW